MPPWRDGAYRREGARSYPRRRRLAGPAWSTRTNHTAGQVRVSYDYVHAVIDDHTRLAYAEVHADETGVTAVAVLLRASCTAQGG